MPDGLRRTVTHRAARPGVRGGAAVTSAIAGILVALLAGVAPLGWTLLSVGLLLASLILGAGLSGTVTAERGSAVVRR